jgi:putative ABC transport system substrate-binding protein
MRSRRPRCSGWMRSFSQRRRWFIGAFLAPAAAVPLGLVAQPSARKYRIGLLEAGDGAANQHFVDAFQRGLRERGYVDGNNVIVDVRWGEGRAERFPELLKELLRLRPDVMVVASTLGAVAAKQVVTTTPVVMVAISDPVAANLVASLAHPGGNMTGISREFGRGLIGKALQLLKQVAPAISRVAIIWNPNGEVQRRVDEAEEAVRSLQMTPIPIDIRSIGNLKDVSARIRQVRADSLMVVTDPLTLRHREAIIRIANESHAPAVYEFAEFARSGGLMSYSASIPEIFARAAVYVDKIIKGEKPADLPIEQATKFELVINLKTAKQLGITVPQSLLLQADEVLG